MSPQPISTKGDITYQLWDEAPNWRITKQVSKCLMEWSQIETRQGLAFIVLLSTNEQEGAALYASLESDAQKKLALRALSISTRGAHVTEVLDKLLAYTKTKQKFRDKLAHWNWGVSKELKNCLILVDPKSIWKNSGHNRGVLRESLRSKDWLQYVGKGSTLKKVDASDIFFVTLQELSKEAQEFRELAILWSFCHELLDETLVPELHSRIYNLLATHARLV